MPTKLLVDPHTKRVVYAAVNGVTPERLMIIDGPRQYLFSPATCEHAIYPGPLPAGFNPQKCWDFRYTGNRIERVSAPAAPQPLAERV
jgi:hypothetical protein